VRNQYIDTHGTLTPTRTEKNSRNSRLLQLPVEIRLNIYDFVFGGTVWKLERERHIHIKHDVSLAQDKGPYTLALLQVCRQLHSETGLLPIKLATFEAERISHLESWLAKGRGRDVIRKSLTCIMLRREIIVGDRKIIRASAKDPRLQIPWWLRNGRGMALRRFPRVHMVHVRLSYRLPYDSETSPDAAAIYEQVIIRGIRGFQIKNPGVKVMFETIDHLSEDVDRVWTYEGKLMLDLVSKNSYLGIDGKLVLHVEDRR
jgi:hypothetical protein